MNLKATGGFTPAYDGSNMKAKLNPAIITGKLQLTGRPQKPYSGLTLSEVMLMPLTWYGCIWSMSLCLFSLRAILYPALSSQFYIAIFVMLVGVSAGFLVAWLPVRMLSRETRNANRDTFVALLKTRSLWLKRVFWALCIVGFLGTLLMYTSVGSQISPGEFLEYQSTVKAEIVRSWAGAYLSMAAFAAVPIGAAICWMLRGRWYHLAIPLALCGAFSFSFWGRVPLAIAVCMLVGSRALSTLLRRPYHPTGALSLKPVLKRLAIGLGLVLMAFSLLSWTLHFRILEYGTVGGRLKYNPYHAYTRVKVREFFEDYRFLFGSPQAGIITYAYLANPIATLDYWVRRESEYGLGNASFPYFFRLASKLGLLKDPTITGDRSVTELGLQLPTYLGYAYIDFGWLGVFLYPFLFGYIATSMYHRFLVKPTLRSYFYLPLVYMFGLLSPFVFVFQGTEMIVVLFWTVVMRFIVSPPGFMRRRPLSPRGRTVS